MEPSTPRSTPDRVDSRWWLAIAAAAVFWVLAYVVGVVLFLTVFLGFLGGVAGWPFVAGPFGGPGPGFALPVGFGLVLLVVIPLAFLGLALGLLLPVALYLDAEAVGRANVGWDPDPVLYAIVGVVGLFAQGVPVQPAVALYYLYRRHQHVGTP